MAGHTDFLHNMLVAEKQALDPLMRECVERLDLSETQAEDMEGFMSDAWIAGALAAHANVSSKVLNDPLELDKFEAKARPLVEESADTLNLTVLQTVQMWRFLSRAMVAGVKSTEAELAAMLIEREHDIAGEALDWLSEREGPS